MRLLRLLIKVAFICNICFVLTSLIQWIPNPPEGQVVSTIIILGYVLSVLINLIVNGWLMALLVLGKWRRQSEPIWLLVVNSLFFLIQVSLIIYKTYTYSR